MGRMWSSEGEYLTKLSEEEKKAPSVLSAAQWAKANPDQAAYDEDGKPLPKDEQ